ncbi:MAG: tetratricopeptide repeat protein, partial [Pyrinomonadaceae bacterium]|nr:tetratricopeptide repeat protein [Pyrinomonadaceae bacterium]
MSFSENSIQEVDKLLTEAFVLHKMGYVDSALKKCLKSIDQEKDNEEIVLLASELLAERNDPGAAYELLSSSRRRFPDCVEIDAMLGKVCIQLGRISEALMLFSTVLDKVPNHNQSVVSMAGILLGQSDFDSACETLDK